MSDNAKNTVGSLKISEEVISKIAETAAIEVEGVAAMANVQLSIKSVINKYTGTAKSINITVNDDVAVIDVYVTLKHGAKIPTVATAIQESVKGAVQNMTGLTVAKVNVNVAGIVIEEEQSE
ncbi:MAG: Asp23/Gls24 family envelope stress response protein [Oscillospiraceae bacterium]|nr:Asp23/Gls24 family envelope stress response protein [Oscillospiraceae bacterium]